MQEGHLLHAGPGVQGQAARAHRGGPRLRLKRLLDPAVKSPWPWLIEGKIVGSDEARATAAKTGQVRLRRAVRRASRSSTATRCASGSRSPTCASSTRSRCRTPRPSRARSSRRTASTSARIRSAPGRTCSANTSAARRSCSSPIPATARSTYTPAGPIPPESQPIAAALKGKRLPLPDRIEISIIEEGQARWLAFLNRRARPARRCRPRLRRPGARRTASSGRSSRRRASGTRSLLRPNTWWTYFNMEDPVVGGYTPEKIALRRAIGMAYDVDEVIRVLLKGRAVPAVSPDSARHRRLRSEAQKTQAQLYDPAAARALLDRFGYKDRDGDGYRETPDGKPLVARALVGARRPRSGRPTSCGRRTWTRSAFASCSRRTSCPSCARWRGWARSRCAATAGTPTIRTPRTSCSSSTARTRARRTRRASSSPEFDQLYDEARALPDSPERTRLFDRMTELVRRVRAVAAARSTCSRTIWCIRGCASTARTRSARRPTRSSTSIRRARQKWRKASRRGRQRSAARRISTASSSSPKPAVERIDVRRERRARERRVDAEPCRDVDGDADVLGEDLRRGAWRSQSPASARGTRSANIQLAPELAPTTSASLLRDRCRRRCASAIASAAAARFAPASRLLTILNVERRRRAHRARTAGR